MRSHRLSSAPEDEKLRSAPHHSHLNHHVEHHHEDETDGEADGAEIGVLTFGGFGDEFLDDHVEHGAGGEGEHVGKDGHEQRGEQEDGDGSDGKAMDCRHLFGAFAVSNLKTVFRGSLYGKG